MAKSSFGKKSSTKSAVGKSKVIKSGPMAGGNPSKGPKMKAC
jgi:hypothetical protein